MVSGKVAVKGASMLMREWATPRTEAGDCTYSFVNLGAGVLADVFAELLGALVARELLACLFSVDWWRWSVWAHGVIVDSSCRVDHVLFILSPAVLGSPPALYR
jgi:hypothetical protein